jgi:hypothetical protein
MYINQKHAIERAFFMLLKDGLVFLLIEKFSFCAPCKI